MIPPFTRPPKATRHCRHYSYERAATWEASGPRCAVGVDLSAPAASNACMPQPKAGCDRREEYTDTERAAWQASVDAGMLRLAAAVQALPAPIPLRSGGNVPCPSCGGSIRFDRWHRGASLACSTEGCCAAQFNIAAGADWPSRKEDK